MDPETKEAGTEQASPSSPQAGTGTEQASPGTTPPTPAPAEERMTASELAEARRQAAAERKRASAAEARLKELEDAQLSEQQRIAKQAQEAQAQVTALTEANRALHLHLAILRGAGTHKIDPAAYTAALKLINPALVEWDPDTGEPTGASVKKALEDLVKENPFLVQKADTAPAPPPGPHAPPPAGVGNGNEAAARQSQSGLYSRF